MCKHFLTKASMRPPLQNDTVRPMSLLWFYHLVSGFSGPLSFVLSSSLTSDGRGGGKTGLNDVQLYSITVSA